MGFMDRMLAKQERSINERIIALLIQAEPQLKAKSGTVMCRENPDWTHQSIDVETPEGEPVQFHRCRNVWHVGTGLGARPIANVDLRGGIVAGAVFIAHAVRSSG